MRLRSWRGTTVVTSKPRWKFPWIRILIVLVVLAIAYYLFYPNVYSVRADAIVRGDLVPVTPEFRARLDKLLVGCNRSVLAGQPVAIVSNFLLQADYQRQYLQGEEQTQLASDALAQNVATSIANSEALHEKYLAAELDSERLAADFGSYDRAFEAGAVSKVTRDAKQTELRAARELASGALESWKASKLLTQQITAAQTSRVSASQDLLTQAHSVEQRLGSQPLYAPVTGDIVDCLDRPQIVIEAGTPIFDIFSHQKAYIVAYFNPDDIGKVHVGGKADVNITGLSHHVTGRIAWIYPDLDALPPELTRFFWQHVQFSEFRPVKIALDGLPAKERGLLYYNAQARVSIETGRRRIGPWLIGQ
jgi:multidrug resistance efflux pump